MPFAEISKVAGHVLDRLRLWSERARQRRALGELNDYLLRDIGLTRGEARAEGARLFWRGEERRMAPRREASPSQLRFVVLSEKKNDNPLRSRC